MTDMHHHQTPEGKWPLSGSSTAHGIPEKKQKKSWNYLICLCEVYYTSGIWRNDLQFSG